MITALPRLSKFFRGVLEDLIRDFRLSTIKAFLLFTATCASAWLITQMVSEYTDDDRVVILVSETKQDHGTLWVRFKRVDDESLTCTLSTVNPFRIEEFQTGSRHFLYPGPGGDMSLCYPRNYDPTPTIFSGDVGILFVPLVFLFCLLTVIALAPWVYYTVLENIDYASSDYQKTPLGDRF